MLLDLKELISKYNIEIKGVIHIGAHFGEEYELYKSLNIKNLHFFEPVPSTFEILKNNVKDAKLYNVALGNISGEIEMNIETANQGQSNSILEPDIHLKQYPHITFNNKIKVKINKLDEFNISNCNIINIDVQGFELEVFKGSVNTLDKIDYIISEVNREEVYKNCANVHLLDKFLNKYNFKRMETNWEGVSWGDAFYQKQKI